MWLLHWAAHRRGQYYDGRSAQKALLVADCTDRPGCYSFHLAGSDAIKGREDISLTSEQVLVLCAVSAMLQGLDNAEFGPDPEVVQFKLGQNGSPEQAATGPRTADPYGAPPVPSTKAGKGAGGGTAGSFCSQWKWIILGAVVLVVLLGVGLGAGLGVGLKSDNTTVRGANNVVFNNGEIANIFTGSSTALNACPATQARFLYTLTFTL